MRRANKRARTVPDHLIYWDDARARWAPFGPEAAVDVSSHPELAGASLLDVEYSGGYGLALRASVDTALATGNRYVMLTLAAILDRANNGSCTLPSLAALSDLNAPQAVSAPTRPRLMFPDRAFPGVARVGAATVATASHSAATVARRRLKRARRKHLK